MSLQVSSDGNVNGQENSDSNLPDGMNEVEKSKEAPSPPVFSARNNPNKPFGCHMCKARLVEYSLSALKSYRM